MLVSKRLMSILVVLAVAIAMLSPVTGAAAQPDDPTFEGFEEALVEKSASGSYVVVMAADPLVVTQGKDALDTTRARTERRRMRDSHDRALRQVGATTSAKVNEYTNALNGFSATISHDQAIELASRPDVALVLPDVLRQPTTDATPKFLGISTPGGAWDRGVTGEGVVVGVIDTGIWPEHPSFADDGTFPAPPVSGIPCEFGNTAHHPADVAFTCQNKLLGARQMLATYRALIGAEDFEFDSARDDNGHGTHTASTAAGNANVAAQLYGRPAGTISGIAPRAHVIAYKGLGNLGGFTSDLAGAIDQAVLDGVDVINYSIGGGARIGTADDIAFLFANDAGVWVATSAGNSGPGPSTVGGPGNSPWITTVAASTHRRFFEGQVVLGNGAIYSGASITEPLAATKLVDAADAGDDLCGPDTLDPDVVAGAVVLCRRGVYGRAAKGLAVLEAGGVGMIMYENDDAGNLFSDTHWVPTVHVDNTPGLAIKAYIASSPNPTARIRSPKNGQWSPAPSITSFSSRGPNSPALDIIKPDITAPGLQILAGNSPFNGPGFVQGELFQAIAGTSMSSPHIAGIFALLKQEHPEWSAAAAKSALMTTAYQDVVDNDRVTPAGPFATGAGHVNPGSPSHDGSIFRPGLVYDAALLDYFAFLCDAFPAIFANPTGTCGSLASSGFSLDASDLNLSSIGIAQLAGSQTVTRTVTNVDSRRTVYTVSVDEPEGYDVSVSPSSFLIHPGESVTYEVTISNDGTAPLGEWRSGSLTWTSGRFRVYSPIAVNAAEFDAPAEISGSGATGNAGFTVKFGYTGAYSATSHGLVPATAFTDVVLQDPDQTFDPNDGYSKLHTITVNDAAHLRLAIPPEATEAGADLDLFLFNPSGQFVASSVVPATDEQIDIPAPANGTWFAFVHGWLAPGGDSPYTLYTWALPNAPGGSLSISGVPPSATIGAAPTLTASWTGAGGVWSLGAVSHNGPNGRLGLTLVDVDNRP